MPRYIDLGKRRHIDLGKSGEDLAAEWLVRKEYEILHRNWRSGRYEVDIIARQGNVLHFIEVKCRQWSVYGPPEESVSRGKIRNMMRGALAWRIQFSASGRVQDPGSERMQDPRPGRVQYDVLSITIRPGGEPEFFFIEDVYL
jgi:putative endonuclease